MSQVITNLLLGSYFYNFLDFKKKLEQDYGKEVKKIQFKDDEGDFITITSDLELLEARKLGSTEFKIIFEDISEPVNNPSEFSPANLNPPIRNEPEPVVHSAYCDNCQATIVGIRYKCANCDNYDLCHLCEAENSEGDIHDKDHVFLKIYRPVNSHYNSTIPNIYKPINNPFISSRLCPGLANRFSHSRSVSCPYIKSLESRLQKVEQELDDVHKNLIKNNEQSENKQRAEKERKQVEKERKQAEKRKENQLRKQVKQQRRRSKKLLKQQQKILNSNPSFLLYDKEISEVQKEPLVKENISTPEPQSNAEENDSEPQLVDEFEDLVSLEEKVEPQPVQEVPSVEPVSFKQFVSPYEDQLSILNSMGFNDRNLNESLLVQFKSVNRVIEELLD